MWTGVGEPPVSEQLVERARRVFPVDRLALDAFLRRPATLWRREVACQSTAPGAARGRWSRNARAGRGRGRRRRLRPRHAAAAATMLPGNPSFGFFSLFVLDGLPCGPRLRTRGSAPRRNKTGFPAYFSACAACPPRVSSGSRLEPHQPARGEMGIRARIGRLGPHQ